ncbi:MAG TPA: glutamate dehydrogenase, partial [Campylobacterales bacterium]|nr:glutamate dehydrogenase [Campylobacterales bacterium]
DIYKDKISVVGIGSMRGDVFGNGMLINPNILLLAAISHSEIFIDPNPDPEVAYKERLRLFRENKNWSEYNKNLISKGGGVFKRNQRNIELTPQIQKLLKTKKVYMSGEELAKRVLMTNVDLLYFGGVGTYVKSSEELNIYIGDKENEGVRINANDLRCFAVCEGGNLGFTQKARIEYAKNGGKINLDSIDNSAGVDTSDHEVNLKIVLNSLKKKGVINEEERIKTLKNLTDKVLNSVFWTNYHQSLAISLDEIRSSKNLSNFIKSIEVLENSIKIFKRRDFDIPKPADFETILTKDNTIVRPILGILLSYSKILIKQVLLNSQFLDTPLAQHYFFKYFPKSFVSLYEKEVNLHPLKREITATVIANYIINNTGSSFIVDFEELKEEGFIKKIESYLIMNRLLDTNDIRYEIYRNDFLIDTKKQYQLLLSLEEMIDFSVRWMIKKENKIDPILLLSYKQELKELLIKAKKRVNIINITPSQEINIFFSFQDYLKFTAAAIDIKQKTTLSFSKVAKLFFLIIDRFKINELLDAIKEYKPISKNEHLVKKELEELVEYFVVKMGIKNLKYSSFSEDIEEHFKNFLENNYKHHQKVLDEIKEFEDKKNPTLALLSHLVNSLVLSIIY